MTPETDSCQGLSDTGQTSEAAESSVGNKFKTVHLQADYSLMLQSGALAAEGMRWLWGPRTVIIGSNSLI
jgi:hypothetical protein